MDSSTEISNKRKYYIWVMLAASAVAIFYLSQTIYGDASGIARLAGNWLGSWALGSLAALAFLRKATLRPLRLSVSLTFALVGLVLSNAEKAIIAIEAKDAVGLMAGAAGPSDLQNRLAANSDNRIVAFAKFAADTAVKSGEEIQRIVVKITPPELDAPIAFEHSNAEDLRRYHEGHKIASGNAAAAITQIDFVFQRERALYEDYLTKMGVADDFKRSVYTGHKKKYDDYMPFYRKLLELKGQQFDISAQIISVLIAEQGRFYRDKDGHFVFKNDAVVTGFNKSIKDLEKNTAELASHAATGEAIDQRYAKQFQETISRKF